MCGFLPDFRPLQLRRLFAFPILRIYGTFPKLFSESPHPTSRILVETTIPRGRQRWADLCQISAHLIMRVSIFQFYGFTELFRNYPPPRTITSDESHLGQNDNFVQAPTVGGFLPYFRPIQLRGLFAFPILRFYGTFPKLFPESSLPMSHILAETTISRRR